MRTDLETRVARAKALGRPTHAEFKAGMLHALHCKLCGTKIAGLVPHERETTEVVNGQHIVRQQMVFAYNSNYREALLEFDDGSRHVSSVCADCAPRLNDPTVAEDAYAMDISQWASEGAQVRKDQAERAGVTLAHIAVVIQE